jgi:hypothetical protein
MQNTDQFQTLGDSQGEIPPEPSSEDTWVEFNRDLETLGRQISQLRLHTATLGDHLVASLEAQHQEVRRRAHAWKEATERHIGEVRESTRREAYRTYGDIRERSKATALHVWERSEPLRQGARDVGEGLVRAWAELRASMGKAANRLSSAKATDADQPAGSEIRSGQGGLPG